MKRMIAIVLALTMMLCIFALPAVAEAVEARYPTGICPNCDSTNVTYLGRVPLGEMWFYHYHCNACGWTYYEE